MMSFKKSIINPLLSKHGLYAAASKALILKIFSAVLALLLNIVLARMLGAHSAGIYYLLVTISAIISVVGCFGINTVLVKIISSSLSIRDFVTVNEVYKKAIKFTLIFTALLSFIIFYYSPFFAKLFQIDNFTNYLKWISLGIIPHSLVLIHASALRGRKEISTSVFISNISIPLITLIGILIFSKNIDVKVPIWSYIISIYITLIIGFWRWKTNAPKKLEKKSYFGYRGLFSMSTPLFWVDIFIILMQRLPIIILGFFITSENIAIFNIAMRTALLMSFVAIAVNSIAAPIIAELYKKNNLEDLKIFAFKSSQLMALVGLVPLLIFIGFPKSIMGVFGSEFVQGSGIFRLISISQFLCLMMGTVSLQLTMTGNEKIWRNIVIVSFILFLSLALFLVPKWGIWGAAIAHSITLPLQSMLAGYFVWKKIGLINIPVKISW